MVTPKILIKESEKLIIIFEHQLEVLAIIKVTTDLLKTLMYGIHHHQCRKTDKLLKGPQEILIINLIQAKVK